MTAKGALASDALTTALINLVPRGIRPRCSDPETHYMWLSEDEAERKQGSPLVRRLSGPGRVRHSSPRQP
jgi:hypothetical protein